MSTWQRLLRLLDEGDRGAARRVMIEAARRGDDAVWQRAARLLMRTPLLEHADHRSVPLSLSLPPPLLIAFDATGRFLALAGVSTTRLTLIDCADMSAQAVPLPDTPLRIRAHPFQQTLYLGVRRHGLFRLIPSSCALEHVDTRGLLDFDFRPDGALILLTPQGLERYVDEDELPPGLEGDVDDDDDEPDDDDVVIRLSDLGILSPLSPRPLPEGTTQDGVALVGAARWLVERRAERGVLHGWSCDHLTGAPESLPAAPVDAPLTLLDATPDGAHLLLCYEQGTRTQLLLVNREDGVVVGEASVEGFLRAQALSPDGAWVAALTHENELLFWPRDGLESAPRLVYVEPTEGARLLFDPWCGVLLLATGESLELYAVPWMLRQSRRFNLNLEEPLGQTPPAFAHPGLRLLTASAEGDVLLTELRRARAHTFPTEHPATALALSEAGHLAFWACFRRLERVDLQSERRHSVDLSPGITVLDLQLHPGTLVLAVALVDHLSARVELRDATTLERLSHITCVSNTPIACAFSPDGGHLFILERDGFAQLWGLLGEDAPCERVSGVLGLDLGLEELGRADVEVAFDGEGVWIFDATGALHRITFQGRLEPTLRRLGEPFDGAARGAFSAGGRYLAWHQGEHLEIGEVSSGDALWSRSQELSLPTLALSGAGELVVIQTFFHSILVAESMPRFRDPAPDPAPWSPPSDGASWNAGRFADQPERFNLLTTSLFQRLRASSPELEAGLLARCARLRSAALYLELLEVRLPAPTPESAEHLAPLPPIPPTPEPSPHRPLDVLDLEDLTYSPAERAQLMEALSAVWWRSFERECAQVTAVWRFEQRYRRLVRQLVQPSGAAAARQIREATARLLEPLVLALSDLPDRAPFLGLVRDGELDVMRRAAALLVWMREPIARDAAGGDGAVWRAARAMRDSVMWHGGLLRLW